jgi:hypothetical protein
VLNRTQCLGSFRASLARRALTGVEFVPILPSGVILFLKIGPRALFTQERAMFSRWPFRRPFGRARMFCAHSTE